MSQQGEVENDIVGTARNWELGSEKTRCLVNGQLEDMQCYLLNSF